jgi:hypothetical protein
MKQYGLLWTDSIPRPSNAETVTQYPVFGLRSLRVYEGLLTNPMRFPSRYTLYPDISNLAVDSSHAKLAFV